MHALLIDIFGPDELFQLENPYRTAEEKGVDVRVERSSWTPRFHCHFVETRLGWEPNKTVAFDAVTAPRIHRIHLQKQVWPLFDLLLVG